MSIHKGNALSYPLNLIKLLLLALITLYQAGNSRRYIFLDNLAILVPYLLVMTDNTEFKWSLDNIKQISLHNNALNRIIMTNKLSLHHLQRLKLTQFDIEMKKYLFMLRIYHLNYFSECWHIFLKLFFIQIKTVSTDIFCLFSLNCLQKLIDFIKFNSDTQKNTSIIFFV